MTTDAFLQDVARHVAEKGLEYWEDEYKPSERTAFTQQVRAPIVAKSHEIPGQIIGRDERKFIPLALSKAARKHLKGALFAVRNDFGETGCLGLVLVSAQGRIIALRFEAPEARGDKHPYFHVQLCNRFHKDSLLIACVGLEDEVRAHGGYPDTTPAFPLHADAPRTLFYSALASLFGSGTELLDGVWLNEPRYKASVAQYTRGIPSGSA